MSYFLERTDGQQPAEQRVDGDVLRIGRGTNAGLRLDDGAVALEHAAIERDPAGYKLVDHGSVTGTYLNGKKVDSAYLADGDVVDVGGFRLRVRWPGGTAPLFLSVSAIAEPEAPGPAAAPAPAVDYLGAYRLRRPFLTKGALAVFLGLAGLALLASLPLRGRYRAFQPGGLIDPHAKEMKGAPRAGCLDCHAPWKGPSDALCRDCHTRPEHQARQAFDPSCSDCHFEHRGTESMLRVSDAGCLTCHGDLKVKDGGEPAVARHVERFPAGHPDFSVTLAGRRLPLAEAVRQKADPAHLRFGHRKHLEKPLPTAQGNRLQLTCERCHQVAPGAGATDMRPVSYETACAGCHLLTFNSRVPDAVAPHSDPESVHRFLTYVYSERRDETLSVQEVRRRILRNPGSVPAVDLSTRATRERNDAERYLFGTACRECHEVNLDAVPLPAVERPQLPAVWLPRARFSHAKHAQRAACADCHTSAAASAVTADVLIPGIAACGGCHGGEGAPPGTAKRVSGPSGCLDCHRYHPKQMARGATAQRLELGSPVPDPQLLRAISRLGRFTSRRPGRTEPQNQRQGKQRRGIERRISHDPPTIRGSLRPDCALLSLRNQAEVLLDSSRSFFLLDQPQSDATQALAGVIKPQLGSNQLRQTPTTPQKDAIKRLCRLSGPQNGLLGSQ